MLWVYRDGLKYLDNIIKFPSTYKKNIGKTKWLIADYGWTQKNKDAIRKELSRIGNIQMEYFNNWKELIKKINVTPKSDPIKTFTVFSHGYPGKIMFGYDSHNNQKKFDFRVKDIKKLRHSAFKNTGSVFYSCRTAFGAKKKNFAYQWQFFTGGRVVAYKGRTNYKYINSEYSSASYYFHRVWDKITGKKEEVRRYPQKSRNMPTGKEKVIYNPMVIRAR